MSCTPTISGIGLVTPLGLDAAATWAALLHGQSISDHAKVTPPDPPAGPRVCQLARRAAAEALREANWRQAEIASDDTGLVVGTSKGPVEAWIDPHPTLRPSGLAEVAESVAEALGIGGPRLTLSAACASGLHALARAVMLIQDGRCQRVLVVAAEASVHPLFVASFKRLGVLAAGGAGGAGASCRPFDRDRTGFLMSDAAAAICLEADAHGSIRVERCAIGSDPTHLTGLDPSGRALSRLIETVGGGGPVDLVHAHGTGTLLNDPVELAAIQRTLTPRAAEPIALYSHKAAIGHSLGASALVSVAINVMCHRHHRIPSNIHTPHPIPSEGILLPLLSLHRQPHRSIALAAGFGGAIGAVSLVCA